METTKTSARYSPEMRARAVRTILDHQADHPSQWAAIGSIAPKIGSKPETLRSWVRQAEWDQGLRPGPTSEERERIKVLEREVRELSPDISVRPEGAHHRWREVPPRQLSV
jgi:transposase